MKADYGTYLRKQELAIPLAAAAALASLSFAPLPRSVRGLLRGLAAGAGVVGLYNAYTGYAVHKNDALKLKIRDAVLDLLAWDGQGKALDIGTGAGLLAVGLALRFPEASVTGCDLWGAGYVGLNQAKAVANAEAEGVSPRAGFEVASAARLPYGYGEFDAVVSNLVFSDVQEEHNKLVLLMEALRVLRPGGAFAFNDLFLNPLYYRNFNYLARALSGTGLKSVDFIALRRMVDLPPALLPALGTAGILYGIK